MSQTQKSTSTKIVPKFTWVILLIIGCVDIIRGLMHTVFMELAIATFAHLDFTAGNINDQLFQMNVLGVSNLISGILFIIVALKAKHYADFALLYPVFSHIIGILAIRINTIEASSDFLGKYVMGIYMGVCISTFIVSRIFTAKARKKSAQDETDSEAEDKQHDYVLKLAPKVQIVLGSMDLIRGVMHTLLITFAASNIAGFDFSDPNIADLLILMIAFGISNISTGLLHVTIAHKVPKYADFALIMVPIMYILGIIVNRSMGIVADSQLNGQYMMYVYLAVCIVTFIYTRIKMLIWKNNLQ